MQSKKNLLSFLEQPILLNLISGNHITTGITVLNHDLFVVRGWNLQHVDVYNTNNNYAYSRTIDITESKDLRAIVSRSQNNCLYISDDKQMTIYRYNLSNNTITQQWPIGGACVGLSLTSTANILVTLWNINQLEEYTPDGV